MVHMQPPVNNQKAKNDPQYLCFAGVGLNTRVGAARFVVNVHQRLTSTMQKSAGELLKALMSALQTERSLVVRKAYAGAIGSLAKSASSKRTEWLITTALQLYTTPGVTLFYTEQIPIR